MHQLRWNAPRTSWPLSSAVTLAVFLSLVLATPAVASAPRVILIYGPPLPHPVILSDWSENLAVVAGDEAGVNVDALADRPYLRMALFWGPAWDEYVRAGKSLEALHPEQASQRGRLYPATGDQPPLIAFESPASAPVPTTPQPLSRTGVWLVSRLPPHGARVLAQHGVSTRVGGPAALPGTGTPWQPAVLAAAAGLGGAVLVGVGLRLRRRGTARPRP